MRPRPVVVLPPAPNDGSRLGKAGEHILVRAFVATVAVDALNDGVLRRLAWGNDAVLRYQAQRGLPARDRQFRFYFSKSSNDDTSGVDSAGSFFSWHPSGDDMPPYFAYRR